MAIAPPIFTGNEPVFNGINRLIPRSIAGITRCRLRLRYSYARVLLPHWADIQSRVHSLPHSFQTSRRDGPRARLDLAIGTKPDGSEYEELTP